MRRGTSARRYYQKSGSYYKLTDSDNVKARRGFLHSGLFALAFDLDGAAVAAAPLCLLLDVQHVKPQRVGIGNRVTLCNNVQTEKHSFKITCADTFPGCFINVPGKIGASHLSIAEIQEQEQKKGGTVVNFAFDK